MDPISAFGVAGGAVQFLDLATNVFLGLFNYFQSVTQAPKLSHELQQEAFLISTILRDLKSIIESTNNPTTESETRLNDTIEEFVNTMTDIQRRIAVKDSDIIKRLKWPFTEKENEKYLSRLERYKNAFMLALNCVQRYILSNCLQRN